LLSTGAGMGRTSRSTCRLPLGNNAAPMSGQRQDDGSVQAVLDEALERGKREADPAEVADADCRLQELLDKVADPPAVAERAAAPAGATEAPDLTAVTMRTAVPLGVKGRA